MEIILVAYAISAGFMALYFNWIYAVEKGFWAWLFFGELVASFQGLFWPFFINW